MCYKCYKCCRETENFSGNLHSCGTRLQCLFVNQNDADVHFPILGDARNKCFALSLLNFSKLGGNLASGRICKLIMLKSAFLYATPTTWNRLQLITEAPNPVACKNPFLKCLFKCFIDQCVIGTCYKCVDDGALVNIAVVHSSLSKN